jgi:hypothetical protein
MNLTKKLILLTTMSLLGMASGAFATQRVVLGEMITNWG